MNTLFRKLERFRRRAQAAKYAGNLELATFYAYLYGQAYRKIRGH